MEHGGILFNDAQLGPFPMERLKRVDKPTTLITDNVQRIDAREIAFAKAARGDYGPAVQQELARRRTGERGRDPLMGALGDTLRSLPPAETKVASAGAPIPEDPEILSRHVKSLGYFLKADIMGICRLPKSAVYSRDAQGNPIDINYQFAIVIVSSKEYRTVKASMGYDWIADPISFQAYQRSAMIAQTIANYIRRLGYPASAQHGGMSYQVQMPPLILWAGIGEASRLGVILNPFLGLDFKASAVLTDLPLVPDKPVDFGLQDFCRRCKICAEMCPSKAIRAGDKIMYNGYETWKLDPQRCYSFIVLNKRGNFCNNCVRVCPWTKPNTWPHNLVRWSVEHSSLARILAIKGDRLFDSKKANEKDKWWFDLEEVNGVLRIPTRPSDR